MKPILILSSLDTKGKEVQYLKDLIHNKGFETNILDYSMRGKPQVRADISCEEVAKAGGVSIQEIRTSLMDRDEITSIMIKGAIRKTLELNKQGELAGIVGIGGVTNTAIGTDIMKALPFGIPKLMVSSGIAMPSYAASFFGFSDIAIISSVVDLAGLNELTRSVLIRAAGSICGMVETGVGEALGSLKQTETPLIAMTEFGYSETCCQNISQTLEKKGYKLIAFHANGVSDKALENLLDQGIFDAVIDIVPSGLSEELLGGNRAAGPDRLDAAGRRGIPQVMTPCGFDMLSCGPLKRKDNGDLLWVSRNLAARNYYVHDVYRVQARTNSEELRLIAKALADKLNAARGPVKFLIPVKGWSNLSVKGQPLYDPNADRAFVDEFRKQLRSGIEVREFEYPLNSPEFATAAVEALQEMI